MRITIIGTSIGAGVTGGVYFAFSSFVMSALRRLPAREGLVAMQAINRAAPSPLFMSALFGTALVASGLAVLGIKRLGQPGSIGLVAGSAMYLVSTVITVAYHVPKNDALARVSPASTQAAELWRT